ncbi:LuxR C-terminal-related transcriptional regulator [Actinoplanes sp. KI2]|uniref:LuxR C-terminal-related transcriptional regulator n=1 Tax=Actinoplanes sp. KI2 TaxID=2983315 RepID=UPI0021D5DD6B|nr:LuxR C-terminal-related transcriptional regulator [Actinoplanes sp. KI2]MCU7722499.1 LuxR C-terminal-related transcriptional regulator [Actinoplanes sp. KI2]
MAQAHDPVEAAALLHRPALVVLAGPPGCGRTTLLRRVAGLAPGPVHAGGGLAMLRTTPALALSRAVRARLPAHDVHLLAEAVRSRVRGGLLVLDDLQYTDPATLAALPLLAAHCRVLVAVRTPHRLPEPVAAALQQAATAWLTVPPLTRPEALDLARRTAAQLDPATLEAVADRAGGNPLAITALARQAAAGRAPGGSGIDQVAYAIAAALADLPRPARTALAALGLLGRPAPAGLLGPGVPDLRDAGLIVAGPGGDLVPSSTYLAETAAGLLDAAGRVELHTRLAELTPPAEAARHLAAAGDHAAAHRMALTAADRSAGGDRAALLLFACDLDTPIDPRVRIAAADAALAAGRPAAAARVLTTDTPLGAEADVLRGEALLQAAAPAAARAAVTGVPDAAPAPVSAARDRVLLLAELAADPAAALELAGKISARYPHPPPGVAAALAAVHARHRTPGWDRDLAAAAAAGDPLVARWSAWLLVEELVADGRLTEAAGAAQTAARECADELAYGWQTRFAAAADWALALHGATGGEGEQPATHRAGSRADAQPDAGIGAAPGAAAPAGEPAGVRYEREAPDRPAPVQQAGPDAVLARSGNLADRAIPDEARGYATAAAALVEADTGLLGAARARLDAGPRHAATAWVARETAWLDGQPDRALRADDAADTRGLISGLHAITARWAAFDLGETGTPPIPADLPAPARRTLTAWATGTGFTAAAHGWRPVAAREEIRCLLAAGLTGGDPARAVAALLEAERLADAAGLTVLAGRARRGLRRHNVHRDVRSPRSGDQLTRRETDVLRLVAAGEPTRRIAGQLGISAETVDTHIRAGMRKLGARTRTEAAALVFATFPSDTLKDGR